MDARLTPYGYARSRLDPLVGAEAAHRIAARVLAPGSPIRAFDSYAPHASLLEAYDASRDASLLVEASFFALLEELLTKQSLAPMLARAVVLHSASETSAARLFDLRSDADAIARRLEGLAGIADEWAFVHGGSRADEVRAYAADLCAAIPALFDIAAWYADAVPARAASAGALRV